MSLCCLTLIFQKAVEDEIIDFLLDRGISDQGFLTATIEGHGHDMHLATMKEKVRGRAAQTRMDLVMEHSDSDKLLSDIRNAFPNLHITYWTSPVDTFGRLP